MPHSGGAGPVPPTPRAPAPPPGSECPPPAAAAPPASVAPLAPPQGHPGRFSHRPASYASVPTWLLVGMVRDWRGGLVALVSGWFGVPLAIAAAAFTAVFGAVTGLVVGVLGARATFRDVPVFGEVLEDFTLQLGGGLGVLAGILGGLLAGPAVLVGPWLGRFAEDPVVAVLVLVVQLVVALTVAVLYVVGSIAAEPLRMRLLGARRLSRREEEYLLPILHECAGRLGLANTPRLLVDDGREANALAYARHIVVTRGLLREFDYDRAVVASILSHELVHWHNADGVARLFIRGLALPVYLLYSATTWLLRATDNLLIRFLVYLVAWPVLATVRYLVIPVQAASARQAEFRADQGAVVTGDWPALRRALERFQRSFDSSRSGWDRAICASHPPTELRLERLELAGERYPLEQSGEPPRRPPGQPARAAALREAATSSEGQPHHAS